MLFVKTFCFRRSISFCREKQWVVSRISDSIGWVYNAIKSALPMFFDSTPHREDLRPYQEGKHDMRLWRVLPIVNELTKFVVRKLFLKLLKVLMLVINDICWNILLKFYAEKFSVTISQIKKNRHACSCNRAAPLPSTSHFAQHTSWKMIYRFLFSSNCFAREILVIFIFTQAHVFIIVYVFDYNLMQKLPKL